MNLMFVSGTERQYSEPPPPYNPCYTAVRPESPAPRAPSDPEAQFPPNTNNNEGNRPKLKLNFRTIFIKKYKCCPS